MSRDFRGLLPSSIGPPRCSHNYGTTFLSTTIQSRRGSALPGNRLSIFGNRLVSASREEWRPEIFARAAQLDGNMDHSFASTSMRSYLESGIRFSSRPEVGYVW